MKLYVLRKFSLIFIFSIFLSGCGFIKERIFNRQPSISFLSPAATFYTPLASATFTWVTLDALGQIVVPTKPYDIIQYQGSNCTGTVVATPSQLSSSLIFTPLSSGLTYSIRVSVEYGDVGNIVTACSPIVHMDNQNPNAVVFTAPVASPVYRNVANYTFTWSAPADPGASGISYYIYNGYSTNNCSGGVVVGPTTTTLLTSLWAGLVTSTSYSYDITAVDKAGNIGATTCTAPNYVYVDLVFPVVGCTNMTPTWYTASAMPLALTNSCTDIGGSGCNGATLQCSYSADNGTTWGAYGSCSQNWANSTAPAGSKFRVRQSDMAANQTVSANCSILVDKINPVAPTITSSPPVSTSTTNWTFIYNSTDTLSGIATYDCQVDGGGWILGCGTSYATGILAPGAHSFDVRSNDVAGNVSATTTYNWTIDTTVPVCSVTQFGTYDGTTSYWTNNTNPTVSFVCTDDSAAVSVGTFQCSIDAGAWGACSGISYVYPNGTFDMGGVLADGSHTVSVRVQDASTNTGTSALMTYVIDTVVPALTCNGVTNVAWKNAASPAATYGTCSDVSSGCVGATLECSYDSGGTWISCTESVAAIPEGNPVTYWVRATDVAGNNGLLNTCQYKLDRTGPTLSGVVSSACGDLATNPILAGFNYDITPTASDVTSGLSTLTCDGSACTTAVPYTMVGGSLASVTTIALVATDVAGNITNYNLPVYIAGNQLTSTATAPSGGAYAINNPVMTTTLNVTDGNTNNWAVGTTMVVKTDSVCGGPTSWTADQWTVGADTSKQKTTGNYALDGKRKTSAQLQDACGNATAWTGYSATTDLDWSNPVTASCSAVCNGAGDITVTYTSTEPVAACSAGDESGTANTYIKVDAVTSPAQPASGVYIYSTAPASGLHTVDCYTIDNAGNDNRVNDTNATGTQFMTTGVNCL